MHERVGHLPQAHAVPRAGAAPRAAPSRQEVQEQLQVIGFIGDIAAIAAALLGAYWLRFESGIPGLPAPGVGITLTSYLGHLLVGGASLAFVLVNLRLYDPRSLLSLREQAAAAVKGTALWFVIFAGVTLVLKFDPEISRLYCLAAYLLATAGLVGWRVLLVQWVRRWALAEAVRQRIAFVGWSAECARLAAAIGSERNHPCEVAGVVEPPRGWRGFEPDGSVARLGGYEEVRPMLTEHRIDLVMIAETFLERAELLGLANTCEKEMVDFKIVPTAFQILISGLHLETMSGVPVLGVTRLPLHSAFNVYLKRVVDLLGGLVGLVLSAPLIAVFGALVYFESPGPVFYRQRRQGRNGSHFDMVKIRSMRPDAEAPGKVGWTRKDDPRRLRVGTFMRKWNIDELPQFWNVLKGEMSLVGPRPERPELIMDFRESIPHYNARHGIKPGMTGWAQVNGYRGDTDLSERVRCDLYYMENWSLLLDLQIMVLTFLRRDNAC